MASESTTCHGCGLTLPSSDRIYDGYYTTTPECWSLYGEVLASEYQDMLLFGRVHQMTVDSYAVQHAGGSHKDKSVTVHLVGLYLVLEEGLAPTDVPRRLQRLVMRTPSWSHFTPPADVGPRTIFDVALAESREQHALLVREWAQQMWAAWHPQHDTIAELVQRHSLVVDGADDPREFGDRHR